MKNGWLRASGERKWLRLIEFLIVFSRIGEMKKQPTKQTFSNNLLQSQTFETRCLFTRVVKASVNGSSCMQQQSFKWDFFFNRKSPGYIGEWIWTWTWWESFPFLHRIRANWRNLEMHFVKTWWNFGQCLFFFKSLLFLELHVCSTWTAVCHELSWTWHEGKEVSHTDVNKWRGGRPAWWAPKGLTFIWDSCTTWVTCLDLVEE